MQQHFAGAGTEFSKDRENTLSCFLWSWHSSSSFSLWVRIVGGLPPFITIGALVASGLKSFLLADRWEPTRLSFPAMTLRVATMASDRGSDPGIQGGVPAAYGSYGNARLQRAVSCIEAADGISQTGVIGKG